MLITGSRKWGFVSITALYIFLTLFIAALKVMITLKSYSAGKSFQPYQHYIITIIKILNFQKSFFLFLMNVENYTMFRWLLFSKLLRISFTVSKSFGWTMSLIPPRAKEYMGAMEAIVSLRNTKRMPASSSRCFSMVISCG